MKQIFWIVAGGFGAMATIAMAASAPAAVDQSAANVMKPPAAAPAVKFVRLAAFDFAALLPAPPAKDTLAAQVDLEAVLQVQAWRTPEQIAWAKLVEKDQVFNHAAVLGAWFTAERLPATAAFFTALGEDLRAIDPVAKQPFLRPRPWVVDARVQPCVTQPASSSYPSGSGMQSFVWAELLGEMIPAKRDELIARAHRAGWGRVIGGVHFPSDVVAGQRLAEAYLKEARKSTAFREALERSGNEVNAAMRSAGQ